MRKKNFYNNQFLKKINYGQSTGKNKYGKKF